MPLTGRRRLCLADLVRSSHAHTLRYHVIATYHLKRVALTSSANTSREGEWKELVWSQTFKTPDGNVTRTYKYEYRTIAAVVHDLVLLAASFKTSDGRSALHMDYEDVGFFGEPYTSNVMKRAGELA